MASLNRVVLVGNLTRDPELRFTTGGRVVCDFSIAVDRVRSRNEVADYFDVTAWRGLAEAIANYKVKGDPILIEGRQQYSSWEADDGTKHSKVKVVAENARFLAGSTRSTRDSSVVRRGRGTRTTGEATRPAPGTAVVDEADFDDLPF